MIHELSQHIEHLLLRHDCVIVPSVGAFIAHYQSAQIDAETGTMTPPCRIIGFNAELTLNDSLLVNSLSETYDINYPEALCRLERMAGEVRNRLSSEGLCHLPGVGTLTAGANGYTAFTPIVSTLATPRLFGLTSIMLTPVVKPEPTVRPATASFDITPAVEPQAEQATEAPAHRTIEIRLETLRNALTAAIVLLLFVFSSIPAGKGSNQVESCSMLNTQFITAFLTDHAVPFAKQVISPKPETAQPQTTVQPQAHFSIVLASKVSRQGASDLVGRLTRQGLNDAEVIEKPSLRRVVYGSYASEQSARQALRQLQDRESLFADSWIIEL